VRERKHDSRIHVADGYETTAVYAGEAIDSMRAVEPAGAIVGRLVAEAEAALAQRFV
jgi:nitronate monooxygenase